MPNSSFPSAAEETPKGSRLLLIGWDSADWKIIHPMMDRGELPALRSIVEGGVSGNLATLEPQLSPMLWTSIATGKMAYHHGVAGFTEVDPDTRQVVPVSAATRKSRTIWEILSERGLKSHIVGWFATQGERDLNGCMVSNLFPHLENDVVARAPEDRPPPPPGTYWPDDLAEQLDELRVSAHEIDPEEILRLFVPRLHEVDQSVDRRLALLAERLAEAYSIQSAATWLMEQRPDWKFMAVYFRAIDEISHLFMPYHPPRMEGVSETDFELYQHVVAMSYRVHDLMLKRLLHLAGPDAAVVLVSDHGFHSDHLRPKFTPDVPAGITVWHRPQGIFAAKGPGFAKDTLVHGARLLDITPTILHWFKLPIGADMEGRVLTEALLGNAKIEVIPTWEKPGAALRPASPLSAKDQKALLDQFVKLGYIEEISADKDLAAIETTRENAWNLARAQLYAGRFEEALPLLEDCHFAFPERSDHAQLLSRCQLLLGLLDEAEATSRTALASGGNRGAARLLQAYIALQRRQPHRAMELLETVRTEDPEAPQLLHYLSLAYLSLRRWPEAETTARRMLADDPTNVPGHLALARCFVHSGNPQAAVDSALDAIAHDYANPRGHFLLGCALHQLGDWANAKAALADSIQLQGDADTASRLLAVIAQAEGDLDAATRYRWQARRLHRQRDEVNPENLDRLRAGIARRAADRLAQRQRQREPYTDQLWAAPFSPPLDLLNISGLPRSGTSLMMQILAAGGVPLMTDGLRQPDRDNPEGYYEWELIKSLPQNPRIIEQAAGKGVKVISALLPYLPPHHRYQIIFMTRPAEQIARSQRRMIERLHQQPAADEAVMTTTLKNHAELFLGKLRQQPNIGLLEIDYPALVADPAGPIAELERFLGDRFRPGPAVEAVVRRDLFRNR